MRMQAPEVNMTDQTTQNGKLGGCDPKSKPTFALILQAVPGWGDVSATIRLKRFLKAALRSYGLRCTEAREITTDSQMRLDGPSIDPPATTGGVGPL